MRRFAAELGARESGSRQRGLLQGKVVDMGGAGIEVRCTPLRVLSGKTFYRVCPTLEAFPRGGLLPRLLGRCTPLLRALEVRLHFVQRLEQLLGGLVTRLRVRSHHLLDHL